MEQRGPAPKPTNLKQLYRAHERRVPIGKRRADKCWAADAGTCSCFEPIAHVSRAKRAAPAYRLRP